MPYVPILHARRCADLGAHLVLGEGPVWDARRGRLLWVDIASGLLFEGAVSGERVDVTASRAFGETVGAVAVADDGGLVVAGAKHVRLIDPDGLAGASLQVIDDSVGSRLNDAVCDPAGRFLVGTLALDGRRGEERVLSVDADVQPSVLLTGLNLANGMAFSPDGSTLYVVDSIPGAIHSFPYDIASGRVGPGTQVWTSDGLVPDGLTVDAEGELWVAFFGGGRLHRLAPTGEVLAEVLVPAPNTTCPAFVGPALDRLIVTTAREQLTDDQLARWPDSGQLFMVDPGVSGLPAATWAGSTVRQTVAGSGQQTREETSR